MNIVPIRRGMTGCCVNSTGLNIYPVAEVDDLVATVFRMLRIAGDKAALSGDEDLALILDCCAAMVQGHGARAHSDT